ncbi:hypothetical protein BDV18DRAFT_123967 [Aspergillus unguis]
MDFRLASPPDTDTDADNLTGPGTLGLIMRSFLESILGLGLLVGAAPSHVVPLARLTRVFSLLDWSKFRRGFAGLSCQSLPFHRRSRMGIASWVHIALTDQGPCDLRFGMSHGHFIALLSWQGPAWLACSRYSLVSGLASPACLEDPSGAVVWYHLPCYINNDLASDVATD